MLLVLLLANDFMPAFKSLLLLFANFIVLATMPLPTRNLLLSFDRQLFYTLANILAYISDYLKCQECMFLYVNIVEQMAKNINQGLISADNLIKVVKKNKSFAIGQ